MTPKESVSNVRQSDLVYKPN